MYQFHVRDKRSATSSEAGHGRGLGRRAITGLAVTAVAATTVLAAGGTASAASATVSDVTLAWGLSGEQGGGAFNGSCNFLSAGTAGDTGSSRAWTEGDGFYKSVAGDVTIEKPNASGAFVAPTWATKCQTPAGTPANPASATSLTGNRVTFAKGSGTVDVAANTAAISWTGSFTSAFYGGLTYWSAKDPALTVNTDGTGTLTATVSGYGTDQADTTKWTTIAPRTVTLATLKNVTVSASGITVTPAYSGVAVTIPASNTQQAGSGATFGSFPQSFVNFQLLTGQSSYWYSSGGSRDAAKPATPLSVAYTAAGTPTNTAPAVTTQPQNGSGQVGGTVAFTAAASGTPTPTVQWQVLSPGTTTWVNYPGATSTTWNATIHAAGYNGMKVRAVFTNSVGTATTNEATITVTTTPPPDPDPTDSDTQTITATVPEAVGEFAWTIDATDRAVVMTTAQNKGTYLESTGQLKPVKVTDTRAGAPVWSIAGQVGDFTNGLSGKYLGWTPKVTVAGAGATAGAAVAPGIDSGNGLKDSATLGSATAGHPKGTGTLGADLSLKVPAETAAGTYTTTLTLTALS